MINLSHDDFITIRRAITSHSLTDPDAVELFGTIDETNFIGLIDLYTFDGENLYQFLLNNNHFTEADTISVYFMLLEDSNLKALFGKFNQFCAINIQNMEDLMANIQGINHIEFIPLLYRVINEYYLFVVDSQVKLIQDAIQTYHHTVTDGLTLLVREISSLPMEFVSLDYQNVYGQTIPMIMASNNVSSIELYDALLGLHAEMSFDIADDNGHNLLHHIMINSNKLFLNAISSMNIHESLVLNDNDGITPIDIALHNDDYDMLKLIVPSIPMDIVIELANIDVDFLKLILPSLQSIEALISQLKNYLQQIVYDKNAYSCIRLQIISLLNKISDVPNDRILNWLMICVDLSDLPLFTQIVPMLTHVDSTLIIHTVNTSNYSMTKLLLLMPLSIDIMDSSTGISPIVCIMRTRRLDLISIVTVEGTTGQMISEFIDLLECEQKLISTSIMQRVLKLIHSIWLLLYY
jgi:hypothetical protein